MSQDAYVLIVDDEESMRAMFEFVFSLHFPEIILKTAANGEETMHLIAARPPRLLFLDIMMPVMDGYEVCRRLRSDARFSTVRIIAMSGLGDEDTMRKIRQAGADEFLAKPISLESLTSAIHHFMGSKDVLP